MKTEETKEYIKEYSRINEQLSKEYLPLIDLVKKQGTAADMDMLIDLKSRLIDLCIFVDHLDDN